MTGPKKTETRLPRGRRDGNSRRVRERVLVMDDEEAVRNVASDMLEILGYEADVAADGAGAVEQYRRARESGKPFSAVLIDLAIPTGMGGEETLRELRLLDPEVRAIVSSGDTIDPVMSDFRKHGFIGVVAKPYTLDELDKALKQAAGIP